MTADQLKADNARYRLIDAQARFAGIDLVVIGTLLSAVLVGAFRHNQRWSWWAMWLLPLWGASVFIAILRSGVAANQTPPSPFFTGPIVAALSSALLVVDRASVLRSLGNTESLDLRLVGRCGARTFPK